MASIDSIYTDPSDTFAWYIDGNRIAIVTSKGDANTTETGEGKYKAVQLGTTQSYRSDNETKNTTNENPFAAADTTLTVDDVTNISVNDMLKLDSEIVLVTAKPGSQNLTVTRGYRDTTDAAHVNDTEIHTVNYVSGGILVSYHAEPDKLSSITGTIDIENELQPALIDYVKGKALMDAAAITNDPNIAQIKMIAGQQALASYRESLRKFGMKKNDKVGGTRAVVPANLT